MVELMCSPKWTRNDRMEGFCKGHLRVYVRVDIREDQDVNKNSPELEKVFLRAGTVRAEGLLKGFLMSRAKDKGKPDISPTTNILKAPIIRFRDCEEDYCEAFIDYKAEEFIRIWKIDDRVREEEKEKEVTEDEADE